MSTIAAPTAISVDRELVLSRILNAPREKVYRARTGPEAMKQWFAPRRWIAPVVEADVRPGGSSLIVPRAPEGSEFPKRGVYLEVVPNQKLVFTDAFVSAWQPAEKPFMTAILTFAGTGQGRTKYTARALHWTAADREAHEKMEFHECRGPCATQLEENAQRIGRTYSNSNDTPPCKRSRRFCGSRKTPKRR